MKSNYKILNSKYLYNFFIFLSLIIFFFSTTKAEGTAFKIDNIEISKPFEINFDKNEVLDDGFDRAFSELILIILNSDDQKKVGKIKLNEIKGMIETFSIKEEKFIDETYYVNIGVSFNKKKIFKFLESKNVFPSIPIKKKLLFIPIIIVENKRDLLIFSDNEIFNKWNAFNESHHLIEYILPTEDLEDLNLVKEKYDIIEQYDFKEIIDKYNLKDVIVALIFKNEKEVRVLSRISIKDNLILKNLSFSKLDIKDIKQIEKIINNLKVFYEDYWKDINQINTSIKLNLNVKVDNTNNSKISNFEKTLNNTDLIYDFYISKYDNKFLYYQIIFNGTPDNFLKSMRAKDHQFNTQNKIWILK